MDRVRREAVAGHRRGVEHVAQAVDAHGEACLGEAIGIVAAVEAHVVELPIRAGARLGGDDARVLVGLGQAFVHRHVQDREAVVGKHARQLRHRAPLVLDVLQHVDTEYHVEAAVREAEPRDVLLPHRRAGLDIDAEVIDVRKGSEQRLHRGLRREVQQTQPARPPGEQTLEVEVVAAVARLRDAAGALGVLVHAAVAAGEIEELAPLPAAAVALDAPARGEAPIVGSDPVAQSPEPDERPEIQGVRIVCHTVRSKARIGWQARDAW